MTEYACHDCDATFNAPTDTDTCRCPGCGEMVEQRPAAPSAPADADLRDRIAQAVTDLHEQGGVYALDEPEIGRIADAVLAVLPAPADQTAEIERLRTMYDAVSARENDLIEERDDLRTEHAKLVRWHKEDGEALASMRGTIERLRTERAELIRQRDQIAMDTIKALPASADRVVVLREAADAIVAENDRQMWATKPGKHWAADLLRRKAAEAQQAEAEAPLSPYMSHPACGFHWHGRDGMDIPIRDGQPVCPRCELRTVRGTVLREAADVAACWPSDCQNCAVEMEVASALCRMADEAQPAEPRPAEELTSGTRQCGHDDYHDAHEWADKPHIWCPGHSFDDEPAN